MWLQQAGASTLGASAVVEGLRVALALAGVCVLAVVVLRWLASRGVGRLPTAGGRAQVVQRLALDSQRALYLVRVEGRMLLVGTGPRAAPTLIAEWPDQERLDSACDGGDAGQHGSEVSRA